MGKRVIGESFLAAIGNDTDKLLITLRYEFLLVKPWYMCKLIMEMVYTPGVEHWLPRVIGCLAQGIGCLGLLVTTVIIVRTYCYNFYSRSNIIVSLGVCLACKRYKIIGSDFLMLSIF